MDWPRDGTMCLLIGVIGRCDVSPDADGVLRLTAPELVRVTGGVGLVVPPDAFDDLESRGWIVVPESGSPVATEKGCYWAERWLKARGYARGRLRVRA